MSRPIGLSWATRPASIQESPWEYPRGLCLWVELVVLGGLNRTGHGDRDRRTAVLGIDLFCEKPFEFVAVDRFELDQGLGDVVKLTTVTAQDLFRALVCFLNQEAYLVIDLLGHVLGVVALFGDLSPKKDQLLFLAVDHWTQPSAHAEPGHHGARHLRHAVEIVGGARGDVVKHQLLPGAAPPPPR